MRDRLALMLETATFSRIDAMMKTLADRYPWFDELPPEKQIDMAMRFINLEKVGLQKVKFGYDFFLHIIPWLIALLALMK